MQQHKNYFGTDGIRGAVGHSHINPEFVLKLGWALGRVLANNNSSAKKVLIGKDTRVSGYMLESALEAGLSAAGVNVLLLGPMPTPAIAYLTQTLHAGAGIVISASHNLFEDNGIKIFSSEGSKLADTFELAIETMLDQPLTTVASADLGKVKRINDAPGRYIEFCKATIPSFTRLNNIKMVVDCANGATYHIAPNVFSELGADVITINNTPNGFNINQECGSTAPNSLIAAVKHHKADVGIAFDGDGDRVIMVDAQGALITGDQLMYIIACDRLSRHKLSGGIVGTLMSNLGLEQALMQKGVPFIRTDVGDRHVLQALKDRQWKIGGEPSGHIVCLDKTTTGDGIVSALQVLFCMVNQDRTLQELTHDLYLVPQTLINIKTHNAKHLTQNPKVMQWVTQVSDSIQQTGRLLLRASGTEPLLRLMIEGVDDCQITKYADTLKMLISEIEHTPG